MFPMVPSGVSIKVLHFNYSRSLRVLWLFEELRLDYTIQPWERDADFRAPESAAEVHPPLSLSGSS